MSRMISYAQNGEDVILNRIFENQKVGFYIDVGASHPEALSVTKHFYDKGWHGINVDPLRKSMALFADERPRDLNLNLAITSENGAREFYEVTNYPELSTFSAESLVGGGHDVVVYQVETITGNDLFSRYVKNPVDFMKIDVEGAEFEVIKSIDFLKYRPKVLIVEATMPNTSFPGWDRLASIFTQEEWEPKILNSGYVFAAFDGLNRYYVSQENINFLQYFQVGLCLWDEFVVASQASYIAHLEESANKLQFHADERMRQLDELTKIAKESQQHADERMRQIKELTKMVAESQSHADERMRQINELTKMVVEAQTHADERMRQIDELTKMVAEAQSHADERMRQINELNVIIDKLRAKKWGF